APRGRPNTACPRARWCLGWACDAPLCLRRPSLPPTPDSLRPGTGERLSSGGCPARPSDASPAPKTPPPCSSPSHWGRSSTSSSTTSSPRRGVRPRPPPRHEGTKFGSDVFLVADNVLPAFVQEIAKVTTTRVEPECYVPPLPGAEVRRATGEERAQALYFDKMDRKVPVGEGRVGAR